MDKDQVVGSAKQIKGAVKQVVRKAIGDAKLESEGRADKVEGRTPSAASETSSKGNRRRGAASALLAMPTR